MSHKTQPILKVVEIDRLKPGKSQQGNCQNGAGTGGYTETTSSSRAAPTSVTEEHLKTEPLYDSAMFHDSDSEFFQDLVQWCSTPAKEEQVQTIDLKTTERANTIDTPNTQFSPQGWDAFDANSPYAHAGFYNTTPVDPLSPSIEAFTFDCKLGFPDDEKESKLRDDILGIHNLPVVIEELASERVAEGGAWPPTSEEQVGWTPDTQYTTYTKTHNTHTMPFIDQDDNPDLKYGSVIPREVENNNVVISEYVVRDYGEDEGDAREAGPPAPHSRTAAGLSVDVAAQPPAWSNNVISTPEVLSYVEQLEKEKYPQTTKPKQQWPVEAATPESNAASPKMEVPSPADYEPITPKSESHLDSDHDVKSTSSKRRRRESEDSDETYTPYIELTTPRKYKRKKPNVPIKDMIMALESSQQLTKARRGRPPKRRESTVSSVCSVDDNSSCLSNQDGKYRELRDKNNEASKRSRMNRKLKELQMEQLAVDLEERNKKLKVKADILEDMTKRLKDALMTAIMQK